MLSYKCGCGSTKFIVGSHCTNNFVEGRECDFCKHDHNLATASDGKYYCQYKRGTYSCFDRAEIIHEFIECDCYINHETDESYFTNMVAIKKSKQLSGNHLWMLNRSFGVRNYYYLGLNTPENVQKGINKIIELAHEISFVREEEEDEIRKQKAFFADYDQVRIYLFSSDNQSSFVDPNLYPTNNWAIKKMDLGYKNKLGLPIK